MASISKIRRLLKLIARLQSGGICNSKDLAEFCSVSRRTIFRDLRMLQDSGLPVLYDEERQGYWMTTASFLPPTDLTLAETLSLIILSRSLGKQEEGLPFFQAARDASLKLVSNLPGNLQHDLGDLADVIEVRLPRHNPLAGAQPYHELLMRALVDKRSVRLGYNSLFEQKALRTLFSPYRLFFARRSWYAIGRSSVHRAVRTLHLGRILEAEVTEDIYEIPPRFSLARYLGNAWHMIRERGNRTDVTIRFQPRVATNVAEVTWHKTQRIEWNEDGTMDFHVSVDGLKEISWWILGYGDQAEVLEPPELRDMIAAHAQGMLDRYQPKRKATSGKRKQAQRKSPSRSA